MSYNRYMEDAYRYGSAAGTMGASAAGAQMSPVSVSPMGMNAGMNTGMNAGMNTGMNTGMNGGMNGGMSTGASTPGSQLYMGDLDPSWDEAVVKGIWAALGEENIGVRMMWGGDADFHRKNLGYCFVEFPSPAHASNALMKNGMEIPGFVHKKLKLNWSAQSVNNGSGASVANGAVANQQSNNSIFVGDLAPSVTEAQLFDLFINKYPSTVHAKVMYDQLTGISKGYGFVKFKSSMDQQRALVEMQGCFLNGRAIKIGIAGGNNNNNSNSNYNNQRMANDNISNGLGQQSRSLNGQLPQQFVNATPQQPVLNHFTDPNNTTVFVGGLSPLVTEDELRSYFEPFGTIIYVKIPAGKGCGFVQYVERSSAETAITKMQGFPIANSRVRLSWGRSAKKTALIQKALLRSRETNYQQQLPQQGQPLQSQLQLQQQQQQQQQQLQQQQPLLYGYSPVNLNNGSGLSTSQNMLSDIYQPEEQNLNGYDLLPGRENLNYVNVLPSRDLYAYNQIGNQPIVNNGMPNLSVTNDLSVNNTTAALERLNSGTASFSFV